MQGQAAKPAEANVHWKWVILHLARTREFPEGSDRHGYNILAPLDDDGRLDVAAWREHKERCTAIRYWGSEPKSYGKLRHRAGGEGGATWVIDYDTSSTADDEQVYRLDRHHFAVGEYITLSGEEGAHTFRVVKLLEAAGASTI